jgi:hypothetical protein
LVLREGEDVVVCSLARPELGDTAAWVAVTPGSPSAIPAAAMTLAAVADTATARTRARP